MKVKKNSLLNEISSAYTGMLPTDDVTILGVKYTLTLPKPEGEEWVYANTDGNTRASILANTRLPTIAVCLTAINDLVIETLFQLPDDITPEQTKYYTDNPAQLRNWRRSAILDWLREDATSTLVNALFAGYEKLLETQASTLKDAQNLVNGTPSQG